MRARRAAALALGACLAVAGAATAPDAAARPGMGHSIGSRGARTYAPPPPTASAPFGGDRIGRTVTPPAAYATNPAANASRPAGLGRALATGAGVGLLGAGLAGLLRNHGAPASPLRILVELAILFGLVGFLVWRAVRGSGRMRGGTAIPDARASGTSLDGEARRRLAALLESVQRAWTLRDVAALGRLCTPEMTGMFVDQLRELERRGARNSTSRVELLGADRAEEWREPGCEYATLALRYRMIDITTDAGGRVLQGDPSVPREVRELWTLRRAPGSDWVLSAIQQG